MAAVCCVELNRVSYFYPSMSEPVFRDLTLRLGAGWTGIVGPNGAGKTTLLHLIAGRLAPTSGHVVAPASVVICPQRTDAPPVDLHVFSQALDAAACTLRGRLGIQNDWAGRWETLSHGERKRIQIGIALWHDPKVLAIDEPTNHIDASARHLLIGALRTFRGTGLLVSHDRELLDGLCAQCLFIDPPQVQLRPGGYSKGTELADAEQARLRHEREQARREMARLRAEANKRAREAAQADRKRSKRHLDKHDSDGRAKIDLARVSGKDGKAGRLLSQLDGRLRQAQSNLNSIRVRKQRVLSADLSGATSGRNALLRLDAGIVALGGERHLHHPPLSISPIDRIALTGPNGAGKSTLIRHLLPHLSIEPEHLVLMPQEIPPADAERIVSAARHLDPHQRGTVMSCVASLGSDPRRLLETDAPSPGELRKLLLAIGMSRTPHLIIMDEPTNHLDLPSIECLENALADTRCALLLVSHDERFLQRLTQVDWHLTPDPAGHAELTAIERAADRDPI